MACNKIFVETRMLSLSIVVPHHLQLVVMYVASCCLYISETFMVLSFIVTTTSAPCKWMDALEEEFY
jgi:hypothetical protein